MHRRPVQGRGASGLAHAAKARSAPRALRHLASRRARCASRTPCRMPVTASSCFARAARSFASGGSTSWGATKVSSCAPRYATRAAHLQQRAQAQGVMVLNGAKHRGLGGHMCLRASKVDGPRKAAAAGGAHPRLQWCQRGAAACASGSVGREGLRGAAAAPAARHLSIAWPWEQPVPAGHAAAAPSAAAEQSAPVPRSLPRPGCRSCARAPTAAPHTAVPAQLSGARSAARRQTSTHGRSPAQ